MNEQLYDKIVDCDFKSIFERKGYAYFTQGKYNINIIGVRAKGVSATNKFNDFIVLDYKDSDNDWCRRIFRATTCPGLYYLKHLASSKGCAIVVPGQYRGVWKLGYHQGKYLALVQNKPIKVYRDNNKDDILDMGFSTIENGVFGINLHHAGNDSKFVDRWSAGCQVIAKLNDFNQLMSIVKKQQLSKTYTYTLLKEEDL